MSSTKILIAEDHRVVADGLVAMLSMSGGVELLGVVETGEEAVQRVQDEDVDVVLMDVNLGPSMNGIEATRTIKENKPDTKIVVLTMFTDPSTVAEAVKAGADGYLSKGASRKAVMGAIQEVMEGRGVLDPRVTEGIFGRIANKDPLALTDRELSILQLVAGGKSSREIAGEIFLSEETVKNHLTQIFRKLGVSDRTEAVAAAFRRGLVH